VLTNLQPGSMSEVGLKAVREAGRCNKQCHCAGGVRLRPQPGRLLTRYS
jgi:hypothetical protein